MESSGKRGCAISASPSGCTLFCRQCTAFRSVVLRTSPLTCVRFLLHTSAKGNEKKYEEEIVSQKTRNQRKNYARFSRAEEVDKKKSNPIQSNPIQFNPTTKEEERRLTHTRAVDHSARRRVLDTLGRVVSVRLVSRTLPPTEVPIRYARGEKTPRRHNEHQHKQMQSQSN
jgi:hypothetical protein